MPVGYMLKVGFFIADEMYIPIARLTVATIWSVGRGKSAPDLWTGVAQQAADIGFLIPAHHDTSQ